MAVKKKEKKPTFIRINAPVISFYLLLANQAQKC